MNASAPIFNEQRATAETVANQEFYALPTDFMIDDSLSITYSGITVPMRRRSHVWMETVSDDVSTGIPTDYAIYTNQFRLYAIPQDVYTLTLSYVKRLPALSGADDTNDWLNLAYDTIKAATKRYIFTNYVRSYDDAQVQAQLEREAWSDLLQESEPRIMTGRVKPTSF
jgi:hypothetical protein